MSIAGYIVLGCLITMNIATFFVYRMDKRRAQKRMWRVRERTLLLLAALGGAFGAIVGMDLAHHKTRKLRFALGVPAMFVLEAAVFAYIFWRFL